MPKAINNSKLQQFDYGNSSTHYTQAGKCATWPRGSWKVGQSPRGYFHIRRLRGAWLQNLPLNFHVGSPNFASKNVGDKYPKFCPLNFRYNPKCPQNCDSFRTYASCGDRTSQAFSSCLVTWLDLAPKFASKLDVRSKPPLPPTSWSKLIEQTLGCHFQLGITFWNYKNHLLKYIDSSATSLERTVHSFSVNYFS